MDRLSVDEAAAEYGIHRSTIYRAISDARLLSYRSMGDPRTYVDRWDVQRLVDPPGVTRALHLVYESFQKDGEWPPSADLQRDLVRKNDSFDIVAELERLPRDLGWRNRDQGSRAVLTIKGIARCPGSAADVDAFLGFVRMLFERYVGPDENPKVDSRELQRELDLDELAIRRLRRILDTEGIIWAGGGGNDVAYTWFASENIRHFRDIRTIHQYLSIRDSLLNSRPAVPVSIPRAPRIARRPLAMSVESSAPRSFDRFHEGIRTVTEALWREGHHDQAVLEAAKHLESMLRQNPNLAGLSGTKLIDQAFSILTMADPATRTGRGVQEGLRNLAIGAFLAFRNPAAHEPKTLDGDEAFEMLAVFSLLARRIERYQTPSHRPRIDNDLVAHDETRAEPATRSARRGPDRSTKVEV